MHKSKIKSIIKEQVSKTLLHEALENLEQLHNGISTSTMIGKPWVNLISNLETIINEVKDFNGMYSSSGPLPNTQGDFANLQMIIKLLEQVKPVIIGMDQIQRKDI